ncbi:MAG: L-lactate dehydrogenase [Eubacterium sp.]
MLSNRKIVIIGAGHVGSHCAYALAIQGICDEIVFIDTDRIKAESHAMDIGDSVCFLGTCPIVRMGDYKDCEDADIIVISAGVPRLPGQTRLDTLGVSVKCVKDIITHLNERKISGIIITISNPADIIADYVRKGTGLPRNRVFSTGTSLDTARMRRTVGDMCNVDPHSVVGFAMGEHGDSSMVPFSHLTIFGKAYKELKEENPDRFGSLSEDKIVERTHMRGMDIINGKGSTEFGIGYVLADMAKAVLMDEHRVLPASALLEGEYGQENVYAGVPCIIGRNGVEQVIELKLTEEENKKFAASCDIIRKHIKMASEQ